MDMVRLRLQRIKKSNGYLTDFGLKVHRGQLIVGEPEPGSINFWDTAVIPTKAGSSLQDNALSLTVASYDKRETEDLADDENPDELCTPAANILADIEFAMAHHHVSGEEDPTFDKLAESLAYGGSQWVTGLVPELWIQTVSTFVLTYNTRIGDPFQQVAAA